MGAATFGNYSAGKTPNEAFDNAVSRARHESGRGGYSGTIAEKHSFIMFTPPPGIAALDFASWIKRYRPRESGDPPQELKFPSQYERAVASAWRVYDDKWGPAVGVEIKGEELAALKAKYPNQFSEGERLFYFFGWASS